MEQWECISGTRLYAVEVSGWDSGQNFFVERCDLTWSEESGKSVELGQRVGDAAIFFVRLTQPGESERSHPVVYEAERVGRVRNGRQKFRLSMVVPHLRERELSVV
jgi:hypothetical protein